MSDLNQNIDKLFANLDSIRELPKAAMWDSISKKLEAPAIDRLFQSSFTGASFDPKVGLFEKLTTRMDVSKFDDVFRNSLVTYKVNPSPEMWDKIVAALPNSVFDRNIKGKLSKLEVEPADLVWDKVRRKIPLSLQLRNGLNWASRVAAVLLVGMVGYLITEEWFAPENGMATTTIESPEILKNESEVADFNVIDEDQDERAVDIKDQIAMAKEPRKVIIDIDNNLIYFEEQAFKKMSAKNDKKPLKFASYSVRSKSRGRYVRVNLDEFVEEAVNSRLDLDDIIPMEDIYDLKMAMEFRTDERERLATLRMAREKVDNLRISSDLVIIFATPEEIAEWLKDH